MPARAAPPSASCAASPGAAARAAAAPGPTTAPLAIMQDDIHCAPAPHAHSSPENRVMSAMAALERRYDGPIPAREIDAARYPTLACQIVRARARAKAARGAAVRRMDDWRLEVAHARARASDEAAFSAAAAAARRVHMPHIRYYIREARSWAAHLGELEARDRARRRPDNATPASADEPGPPP